MRLLCEVLKALLFIGILAVRAKGTSSTAQIFKQNKGDNHFGNADLHVLDKVVRGEGEEGGDLHAVIVSTSRQWQNYRHLSNALAVYTLIKQQGVPDSQIVLMLAGVDGPCSDRNPFPGGVYKDRFRAQNLFGGHEVCSRHLMRKLINNPKQQVNGNRTFKKCAAGATGWEGVQIDLAGDEVTVAAFLGTLTGLQDLRTPTTHRLKSGPESTVLIFLTGHGGDEFLKFSDWEVLVAQQLAEAVQQMHHLRRFKRMLIIAETCQAATLLAGVDTPGVLRLSSSLKGENSYSYVVDSQIGASLIDRWSYSASSYLSSLANRDAAETLAAPTAAAAAKKFKKRRVPVNAWTSGVGRLRASVSSLLATLDRGFLMASYGAEENVAPGREPLLNTSLEAFFTARTKVIPLEMSYPFPNYTDAPPDQMNPTKQPSWYRLNSNRWSYSLMFSPAAAVRQSPSQHPLEQFILQPAPPGISILMGTLICVCVAALLA